MKENDQRESSEATTQNHLGGEKETRKPLPEIKSIFYVIRRQIQNMQRDPKSSLPYYMDVIERQLKQLTEEYGMDATILEEEYEGAKKTASKAQAEETMRLPQET